MTFPRNLSFFALPALIIVATPARATDALFGTESPLLKFTDFITGPFAYAVVIIALVVTVGVLAIGGEFSGFSRRMPIIVIAGGIVILAGTVMTNLFGGERAADLPEFSQTPPALWSEPAPQDTGLSNTSLSDFTDALRPQPDLLRLSPPDGDDQP